MRVNSRLVMISDAAHGTITAQRTSRRPAKSLDRNCASPRLISTVTVTTATTQTAVFASTVGSAGWVSTCRKLSVPAGPRRSPVIEYRLNAARTSATAG
jgi:hypothetical protein